VAISWGHGGLLLSLGRKPAAAGQPGSAAALTVIGAGDPDHLPSGDITGIVN
jgi:hypothetical protein